MCGLKLHNATCSRGRRQSHPSWVCGLKPNSTICNSNRLLCHTLRGCVDWNLTSYTRSLVICVTPFVGVWIETAEWLIRTGKQQKSHPSWVCGLKLDARRLLAHHCGHTLRGCVDWNTVSTNNADATVSHTLRGCVDWNLLRRKIIKKKWVTPFVGVWIETTL